MAKAIAIGEPAFRRIADATRKVEAGETVFGLSSMKTGSKRRPWVKVTGPAATEVTNARFRYEGDLYAHFYATSPLATGVKIYNAPERDATSGASAGYNFTSTGEAECGDIIGITALPAGWYPVVDFCKHPTQGMVYVISERNDPMFQGAED